MFQDICFALEILLLVVVVIQGEYIRQYEKKTYELHAERQEERFRWREQKRQQTLRKIEPKTSDSSASTVSLSLSETSESPIKTDVVKSASDLSTL